MRRALLDLFQVLDQKTEERDEYLEESLAAFPYVNGGLFTEEDKTIPPLTEEIKELLVKHASSEFDWSEISPTIFGAIFESTLNPETRRSGGMHYTSIENIHKVIDPLFLDDLKAEFNELKQIKNTANRIEKVKEFHKKLGTLKFLDPACGSGNFLTETYLSLRKLGNECIKVELNIGEGELSLTYKAEDLIQVSIQQFYGIEINDFAAVVAKTALWIAESQMMKETSKIIEKELQFLPLHTYANIIEGNALRVDWESVVPKNELSYILGNPPFVGARLMSESQKEDISNIFSGIKGAGNIDYVGCWYVKAKNMMKGTNIRAALVSTNSITQGEQVAAIWKPLFNQFGIHFDFAYRTFRWDSEANIKAHVHCVIIGFSCSEDKKQKVIYLNEAQSINAKNINGYLINASDIFVESRSSSLNDVPQMVYGNKPTDGGFLFLTEDEKNEVIKKEPITEKYIKQILGSEEYINNKVRYCFWLVDANPAEIRKSNEITKRVEAVKQFRLKSTKAATQRDAETPTLFQEVRQPKEGFYLLVPRVSSEKRRYVPIGFMNHNIIVNDSVQMIPNASLYHFGVLTSNVHMAWMRAVAGRLEMRYRYSKDIVYNNFPWPNSTEEQKKKIEQTAQAILDARAKYTDCSLADLYDETVMPPELRKAHQANDRAVMTAYGFSTKMTESECVAELFKMYEELTEKKQ